MPLVESKYNFFIDKDIKRKTNDRRKDIISRKVERIGISKRELLNFTSLMIIIYFNNC